MLSNCYYKLLNKPRPLTADELAQSFRINYTDLYIPYNKEGVKITFYSIYKKNNEPAKYKKLFFKAFPKGTSYINNSRTKLLFKPLDDEQYKFEIIVFGGHYKFKPSEKCFLYGFSCLSNMVVKPITLKNIKSLVKKNEDYYGCAQSCFRLLNFSETLQQKNNTRAGLYYTVEPFTEEDFTKYKGPSSIMFTSDID